MGNATFLSMSPPGAFTVRVPVYNRSTLLSLARCYGVPLRCRYFPGSDDVRAEL